MTISSSACPGRKLERADDKGLLLKRTARAFLCHPVPSFEDERGEEELFLDLLRPPLAQVGRSHDEDAPVRPYVHFWASTKPASMVLPSPTSSARIAPFDKGDLKANSAAST